MNSRYAQGSSFLLALMLAAGLLPAVLGEEGGSENGYLEIWVESDFDDQWGDLYIGDDFIDEYWVEYSGEAYLLDNFSLDAGDYVVTLELDNDASCQEEVTVVANHTSDVLLYPVLENHAPTLHEAWVDPQEGSSETEFTFEVYYRDADNDAPEWVKLRLDNAENYFHMEKDDESDDYTEGVWYRHTLHELEEGEHTYQYIASDGDAMAETEWQEGPAVDNGDESYGWLKVWSINDFDEQWGWLQLGDDIHDEDEVPHGEYLLEEFELEEGWYWLELELENEAWDGREVYVEAGETSGVELRPEHEEEERGDPWFRFVELELLDTDEDDHADTARIWFNGDTEYEELEAWVMLRVWQGDHKVGHMFEDLVLHGESGEDTYYFDWSPDEAGEYAFDLSIGPEDGDDGGDGGDGGDGDRSGDREATDWWEHEAVALHPPGGGENQAPELRDGHVSPEEGTPETAFTFSVIYSDADGDAPHYVKLRLDDAKHVMSRDSDGDGGFGEGVRYAVAVDGLAVGSHTYSFLASDGKQAVDTDWRDGPAVYFGGYGVAVSMEPLVRAVAPGSIANFSVTVLNTGGQEDTFDLTSQIIYTNSSADGWSLTLSEESVTLDAGDFTTIIATMTVPADAAEQDTLVFAVSAASRGDSTVAGQTVASVIATEDGSFLPGPSAAMVIAALGGTGVVASFRRRLRD